MNGLTNNKTPKAETTGWVLLWGGGTVEHQAAMQCLPPPVQAMVRDGLGVVAGGYVLRTIIGASTVGVDVDFVTHGVDREGEEERIPPPREAMARAMGESYIPAARGWASAGGQCTRFQHRWLADVDVDIIFAAWARNTIRSWDATCSMVFIDGGGIWAHSDAVRDILDKRLVLNNAPNDTPRLRQRMVKLLGLLKYADKAALAKLRKVAHSESA